MSLVRIHRKSDGGYRELEEKRFKESKEIYLRAGWRVLKEDEKVEAKKEVISKPKPTPIPPAKEVEKVGVSNEDKVEKEQPKPKRKRKSKTSK